MSQKKAGRQNDGPVKSANFKYRPDIDGLRALAVMAVVVYHYAPGRLPGGFIGVDIFFVISGYLITGIIAKVMAKQTFSLLDFYQRRIRRIFPALILVLLATLAAGWLLLFPSEYQTLGQHTAASAVYLQNFMLWSEAGYFDVDAIQKPLLHLWSLAVEDQFYIVWPLALWVIMRQRWPTLAAITAIAGVSFALNVWSVAQGDADTAFYWPTTRAWELMVGAWLAMAHRRHISWLQCYPALQSWLGLAMIMVGIGVIRPEHFPGFWALLPTLGAALLINAGPSTGLNRRVFSMKPVVWVGLISYPLYLWHWALLSMLSIGVGDIGNWQMRGLKVVLFASSILLSWLTYRYMEKPVQRRGHGRVTLGLLFATLVLGGSGLGIWLTQGLPNRPLTPVNTRAETYLQTAVRSPRQSDCYNLNKGGSSWPEKWSCVLGDPDADTWIGAIGDSHSLSMLPALDQYGRQHHVKVIYAGISGCLALFDITNIDRPKRALACNQLAELMANRAQAKKADAVIYIQRWSVSTPTALTRPGEAHDIQVSVPDQAEPITGMEAFRHALTQTLDFYQSIDIPVVLMEDNPQQESKIVNSVSRFGDKEITDATINASAVTREQHVADQAEVNQTLETIAARYPGVTTPNIDAALCRDGICPWARDGKLLYFNDDHLSISGAMEVYPLLEENLEVGQ